LPGRSWDWMKLLQRIRELTQLTGWGERSNCSQGKEKICDHPIGAAEFIWPPL
jgi:hypothetical protein